MSQSAVYDVDLGEPSQQLIQWAKENLNEDPETRAEIISELRDMIYEKGECIPHRNDDAFLLRFLRARYFTVPRAHRLVVNYYSFKEENPQLFKNVDVEKVLELGMNNFVTVAPYKDEAGRRFVHLRVAKWDPQKCSIDELFQAMIVLLELAALEQSIQISGGISLWDFSGLSMQQVWQVTPNTAFKIVQLITRTFPLRVHALHIVNQSYIFDIAFNIVKPFLNEAMKERIFFHGSDMESLHKHIDPKFLPQMYGGVHPEYDYKDWIKSCKNCKEVLQELKSLGYTGEALKDVELVEFK